MDQKKLYKILEFNKSHAKEIAAAKINFYDCIGRQTPIVISDMQTLAQMIFDGMGYMFLRIPLKSQEIGAFQLRLNEERYLVLNTARSLVNNNFAVAHELYHILIQNVSSMENTGELYLNNYDDIEEEQMANAFAGSIIMPAEDVRSVVALLKGNKGLAEGMGYEYPYARELTIVFSLMSYYQTTYMSVVIRCYELGIFDPQNFELMNALLENNSEEKQKKIFKEIPMRKGNISIMEPTYVDDFERLYNEAERYGKKNVESGLLTEEDLEYRLEGLKKAYLFVKGETQ